MSGNLSTRFENNRLIILKAASRLFCRQGVHAASISDIAKTVKLSKGTVSYYYPSKDLLIYEVTEFHLSEVTDSLYAWINEVSPNEPLPEVLESFFAHAFSTEEKCRLHICLLSDAIPDNDAIRRLLSESISKWRTIAEAGLLKNGCAHYSTVADALFVALDSVIIRRAMGDNNIRISDICIHIAERIS